GSIVPAAKATILDGETRVGTVTTAAWSPGLQRIIALGYLRREHLTPGTRVRVAAGDGVADAEVAPLPFVGQV
ncbi:MAG TPA: glycine cleavage T C-terminal barrel domain-containing protein, partial [Candidatus Sulfotelmatobacter sp.]|nr:glycine cleavage T C-terminal barrel domain-containing protein [Candidatus Sulfotelmatobacter sp.]